MTTPKNRDFSADDVGTFVDEAIRNPERAEDIKNALRERLAMPGVTRLRHSNRPRDTHAAEAEDFWDNVPV